MRLESYRLSRPYPWARVVFDGAALVVSLGRFYFRFQWKG